MLYFSVFVSWLSCRSVTLFLCMEPVWHSEDILFMWWILYALTEGTPFAGGIFRMRLVLGKDFPAVPPKGYFLTKIFHPNVGHKGEICVNVLKRDWKAELGLRHVLLVRWTIGVCHSEYWLCCLHCFLLTFRSSPFISPTDYQVSSHPPEPRVCFERRGWAFAVRGLCRIRVPRSSAHRDPCHGRARRDLWGSSGP